MKNLLKLTFISVVFFSFSTLSYATSGACSSHSGVNCAVGPNINGNVVCNDGWVNSSVSYSSMSECYEPTQCPIYYPQKDYTDLFNRYTSLINEARQKMQSADQDSKSLCISMNVQNYSKAQQAYNSCINYQNGLHMIAIQQNGIDRSDVGSCGQPPTSSNSACANSTSPVSDQYLKLILEAQHEISCLKIFPLVQQKSDAQIKANLDQTVNNVKKPLPEKAQKPVVKTPEPKTGEANLFANKPDVLPTPKITFWNRIGNFFIKLKFW